MSLKIVIFSSIALAISFLQPIAQSEPIFRAMKCGPHEVFSPCGLTGCNDYDCRNQDGKGVGCAAVCANKPSCVCEPKYRRATPGAPCTPLQCKTPVGTSCETIDCATNSRCTTCKPCSSSCANPNPICTMDCKMIPPTCVCNAGYHRETGSGPCVPQNCKKTTQ